MRPLSRARPLEHLILGALLCLTIIGIPLGIGSFKMAGAALVPFGRQIVKLDELAQPPAGTVRTEDFALARYTTSGSLDRSFGTDGKIVTDFELLRRTGRVSRGP